MSFGKRGPSTRSLPNGSAPSPIEFRSNSSGDSQPHFAPGSGPPHLLQTEDAMRLDQRMLHLGFVTLLGAACSKDAMSTNPTQAAAGTAAASGAGAPAAVSDAGAKAPAGGAVAADVAAKPAAASGKAGEASPKPTGGAMAEAGAQASAGSDAPAQPAAASGATGAGCTRELLQASVDNYFAAMAAHDPTMLQRADGFKLTENGLAQELGEGLWQTAGTVKYKHTALDTEACSTVSESVVPDGSTDIPVGLRLKLVDQKISEVELIAVRPGDYKVFGSDFPSNTSAIAASHDVVKWEEVVPDDQRNTRAEIRDWLDKYFRLFPRYGCNLADDCQRLENGGGSFECNAALSCEMTAMPTERGTLTPRTFVIDTERGIGVGFTMFMGNTDFHMIKMYGGEIHAVHAILGAAESSGWD
jgi:hypothetical protein